MMTTPRAAWIGLTAAGDGRRGEGAGRTDPVAFRALIRAPRDPRVCASSLTAAPGSPGRAGFQTGDPRRGNPPRRRRRRHALDAVEAALGVLESNPRFNAGVGGAVQSDGVVRTDAGVMTADREIGAACSMPGVEHAASVARVVVHSETPHIFISGDHAVDLASEFDIETGVDLLTDETRERYEAEDPPARRPREHLDWLATRFGSGMIRPAGGSGSDEESEDDAGRAPTTTRSVRSRPTARRSRRRPPRAAGRSRSGTRRRRTAGRIGLLLYRGRRRERDGRR